MKKALQQVIKILFSILWIWTLLSIILNINLDYTSKQPTNIILCLILALLILIGFYFIKSINFELNRTKKIIAFIIVLIIQIFLFNSILFKTGWDSSVIFNDAMFLRDGTRNLVSYDYYLVYPNNVLLCTLYYWKMSVLKVFGIVSERSLLLVITIMNSVISNVTCLLIYSLLKKKTSNKYVLFGYLLSLLLLAFSPWNLIPYSDQLALIIPITIYYVYDKDCNLTIKYLIIGLLTIIGYNLKPQSIIIVIAIIIVSVFNINKEKIKNSIKPILITLVVLLVTITGFNMYSKSLGFSNNKDQEIGIVHYVKMGLNKETIGTYSQDDVNATLYCETKELRTQYNIDIIKERLNDFGITGYLDFLTKKLCITFTDGTFSWGKEGDFYQKEYSSSSVFNDFYYNDGSYFSIYSNIQTTCWFVILISIILQIVNKGENSILELTIVGIILFQLIFETRARYLLVNVPLLICIAMISLCSSKLYNKVDDKTM